MATKIRPSVWLFCIVGGVLSPSFCSYNGLQSTGLRPLRGTQFGFPSHESRISIFQFRVSNLRRGGDAAVIPSVPFAKKSRKQKTAPAVRLNGPFLFAHSMTLPL